MFDGAQTWFLTGITYLSSLSSNCMSISLALKKHDIYQYTCILTDGFGVGEGGGLGDTKLVVVASRRVGFVWKIRYISQ